MRAIKLRVRVRTLPINGIENVEVFFSNGAIYKEIIFFLNVQREQIN